MARNVIQSRYNIWTALEDVNKDIRALLKLLDLGLTLADGSPSIFEAVPVRNLHVIPMVSFEDSSYWLPDFHAFRKLIRRLNTCS